MAKLGRGKVETELRRLRGNVTAAATVFGVTRQTLYTFIEAHDLQPVLEEARESLVDMAESALAVAVNERAPWAVIWTLKTQGKKRGYVERIENTGANGGPMEVNNVSLTDEERLDRAVALLDKARARRAGQPALEAADPDTR
jgi:hypothetical protein